MPGRLDPEPLPRRDFLGLAGMWTAGIAILGSVIGMARLPKPRVLPEASSRVRLGQPQDYPSGTDIIVADQNVRILATDEGIAAMSIICTHLGCLVGKEDGVFSCPCHGSKFDLQGNVTGGPAPRPLVWLAVSQAADGSIVVDKKNEIEPGNFYQA